MALLEFDLVLKATLPTISMRIMKVGNVFECAHECMRHSTCEAMAFSILNLVCVLYQHGIQEDALAPANSDVLAYNLQRAGSCNGPVGSIPGPAYPACPLGSGFRYVLALNVCYKGIVSYEAGKATCVQEGGSDLLKIDTQEKLDFFKLLVPPFQYTYIRGDLVPSTGEWAYWEEGIARPMPFIEWAPGQPSGALAGETCMVMDATGQHDHICNLAFSFSLCEYGMQ
ncbi:uncharacterized protein [Haliotis asinina]|uniref:uncharacterized protein n=1 Tax=Haliotis asinina TaxID=109174 RepID=UPI003531A325